jgi:NitT/TauT family transport system permease protein
MARNPCETDTAATKCSQVKGVIIGQLLISVVGFGTLFEVYASHFLMEHFWALILVIFAFAFTINEVLAWTERKVSYYASSR